MWLVQCLVTLTDYVYIKGNVEDPSTGLGVCDMCTLYVDVVILSDTCIASENEESLGCILSCRTTVIYIASY